VEKTMAGNPFLERLVASASAPIFDDEIADFLSRNLVRAIPRARPVIWSEVQARGIRGTGGGSKKTVSALLGARRD
jgi:hypothetical protein